MKINDYVKSTSQYCDDYRHGQIVDLYEDKAMVAFGVSMPVEVNQSELIIQTFEEQQKEIRLSYLKIDLMFSPYSEYKNSKGVGCIIHYMRGYGCKWYDTITVGNGEVCLWNKLIATFYFDKDIPIFVWKKTSDRDLNKSIEFWKSNQDLWLEHLGVNF